MKILVCGNGNVTRKNGKICLHHEIVRFLSELHAMGNKVGYATVVVDEKNEKVKNLADGTLPDGIVLHGFTPWSTLSPLKKCFLFLPMFLQIMRLTLHYDLIYCYYPGTLTKIFIFCCRLYHKGFSLYVRGELVPTATVIQDLQEAEFILATGRQLVLNIYPECKNCDDVVPMTGIFQEQHTLLPRDFHTPLEGLFVGRVERNKGVYELLDAAEKLQQMAIPVHFTLVGAYHEEFQKELEKRHLTELVTLAGIASSPEILAEYYQRADFFCFPTYSEGFPRVLYEAMAWSLPCMTTMVGGIPSWMQAEKNCLALEVKSAQSVINAIVRLTKDPVLYQQLSMAAFTTFEQCCEKFNANGSHARQLIMKYETKHKEKTCQK